MEDKITQFWEWFVRHEREFREVVDANRVIEMLNNQVLEFGLFSWQIGEGQRKPFYLCISPNGDWQRLQLSKQIMAQAPLMSQWEFHHCKFPVLDWNFQFEMFNRSMIRQTFDASQWEFALQEMPGGQRRIFLYADNVHTLDQDDLPLAGNLVIGKILGEEVQINHIRSIEFITDLHPPQEQTQRYPLKTLRDQFAVFL